MTITKHMDYTYIRKAFLLDDDIKAVNQLEKVCYQKDSVNVKLELDYKKMCLDVDDEKEDSDKSMNEFLCLKDNKLIGYLGICDFGGDSLEINGLVHPEYRKQGIFKHLFIMCLESLDNRKAKMVLLLSDAKSEEGVKFIHKYSHEVHHSEFEMHLDEGFEIIEPICDIELRLATNKDAYEVDQQNRLYFARECDGEEINLKEINPEDEIDKGFYIYLAIYEHEIVGKVNIQFNEEVSGIYGLGVKPAFRSKGLGRSILTKAIQRIKKENNSQIMLQVEVENDNALNLYKSCGFKVTYSMNYYKFNRGATN